MGCTVVIVDGGEVEPVERPDDDGDDQTEPFLLRLAIIKETDTGGGKGHESQERPDDTEKDPEIHPPGPRLFFNNNDFVVLLHLYSIFFF